METDNDGATAASVGRTFNGFAALGTICPAADGNGLAASADNGTATDGAGKDVGARTGVSAGPLNDNDNDGDGNDWSGPSGIRTGRLAALRAAGAVRDAT